FDELQKLVLDGQFEAALLRLGQLVNHRDPALENRVLVLRGSLRDIDRSAATDDDFDKVKERDRFRTKLVALISHTSTTITTGLPVMRPSIGAPASLPAPPT